MVSTDANQAESAQPKIDAAWKEDHAPLGFDGRAVIVCANAVGGDRHCRRTTTVSVLT